MAWNSRVRTVERALLGDVRDAENFRLNTSVPIVGLEDHEVLKMSKVAVILRILPEDLSVNLENIVNEIKQKLPQEYSLELWDMEPIAFGLSALRVLIVMPENVEGGTEHLEELISQIPGVSQVETIIVHRIS